MIVVADTSVLINLCRIGQGSLLQQLFHEVVVPPEVVMEFEQLSSTIPRFIGLTLPEGIRKQSPLVVPQQIRSAAGLDAGEISALSLALEIHADAVLIDERRGYQVALELGLRVIGVIGILLRAKTAGHLPAVLPLLDALQRDAGFWISEQLRQQVLQQADEAS